MSVGLLAPFALTALAALLLPLLLHLARRDATRPTPFAALRWLRERPKPRRRLRFDDWPLLLVRLLLLALLALWLAWPVLRGEQAAARWTVVVPGVDPAAIPRAGDTPVHWLAPGFPPVDGAAPAVDAAEAGVASLLRELDLQVPAGTALTVVVPETLDGADGGRVALSRALDWRVVPAAARAEGAPTAPPRLDVFAASASDPALRVLRAVAAAWRPDDADALRTAAVGEAPRADAVAAWWGDGAPPERLLADGAIVLVGHGTEAGAIPWRPVTDDPAFERAACGAATCIRAVAPLDPASNPLVAEPAFPARLRALLQPAPLPTRIHAEVLAPVGGLAPYAPTPRDLRPWWALLVALVFALERWMAAAGRRMRNP